MLVELQTSINTKLSKELVKSHLVGHSNISGLKGWLSPVLLVHLVLQHSQLILQDVG